MALSGPSTPRNKTPLKRKIQGPPETPDCFNKVTVETPVSSKTKAKDRCGEFRNLTVAVRVRPMNSRELNYVGIHKVVDIEDNHLLIQMNSNSKYDTIKFQYDHIFWSCDPNDMNFITQEDVFDGIGRPLLDNAFKGYNACLFAYGQTGSGKSYSMMGPAMDETLSSNSVGIIPRFCLELFNRITKMPTLNSSVEISYFEIYNEKIHDLLCENLPNSQRAPLKVREHPTWGPYVVDLSTHVVKNYEELKRWLLIGNRNRATAATAMNEKSSRSHSIFSIELSLLDELAEGDSSRRSKVSLVDLAGSERMASSNNEVQYKQSVSINKSLLTLGKVISALADQRKGNQFVPYRESVLTWLLRESLGGNSLTCMLATVTPASSHVDETLATLRYACQARSIVNRARINEDPHDKLIRELRAEVERLRALRQDYENSSYSSLGIINISAETSQELDDLRGKLNEKENQLVEAQEMWENKFRITRQKQLRELADAEKRREELESHVRIMSSAKVDVSISPYQTKFLEELENVLLNEEGNNEINYAQELKRSLDSLGHEYEVSLENSTCTVYDKTKLRKATCSLNEVDQLLKNNTPQKVVKSLNWKYDDNNLSEKDLQVVMERIYNDLNLLKVHTEREEHLRLTFAKFIKSAQDLESALKNSIKEKKKTVSFRI